MLHGDPNSGLSRLSEPIGLFQEQYVRASRVVQRGVSKESPEKDVDLNVDFERLTN